MLTGQIANGVIKIVLDGISAAQKQLASVQAAFDKTAKSASKISNQAAVAFASASASVTAFARVADPLGALQLDIAFARVSVQLGRFFIPLLHQAADALNRLANYLNSLSDDTRESVLHWTKLALAITGTLTVAGKLVGVFGGATAALGEVASVASGVASVLWRILGFLGPWGRLIVIIGTLAAAFIGLNKAGQNTEGLMGRIVAAGKSAWEALKQVWGKLVEVVGPAIAKAGAIIEATWAKIVNAVSALWEKLSSRLGPPLEKLGGALGKLFATFGPVLKAYVERWGRDFERFGQVVAVIFEKLTPIFEKVFGGDFVSVVERAINRVTRAIETVQPYAEKLADWITKALESDKGKDFGKAFASFADDIGNAISFAIKFANAVNQAFAAVERRVAVIRDAFSGVWDKATSKTTSFVRVLEELGKIGDSIAEKFNAGFNRIAPYLERIAATASKVFDDIKAAAEPVFNALSDAVEKVSPVVSKLFDKLAELGAALVRLGGALWEVFGAKLANALKELRPQIESALGAITEKLEKVVKFLAEGFEEIYPRIKRVIDAIGRGFVTVINYIRDRFYDFVEAITSVVQTVIDKINKLIDGLNSVNFGKEIAKVPDVKEAIKRPEPLAAPDELPDLKKQPRPLPPNKFDRNTFVPIPNPFYKPKEVEVAPPPHTPQKKEEPPKKEEKKGNQFVGQLLGNARFIGIAEAMRAAQQATVPTRETAILEEIARGQKDANANLSKIAENTQKGNVIGLK